MARNKIMHQALDWRLNLNQNLKTHGLQSNSENMMIWEIERSFHVKL